MGYFENFLTETYSVSEQPPPFDQTKPEQGDGEGLLGDPPDVSAASDDLIDSTPLGQHLLLFEYLAEPVVEADDGHLHHHSVWLSEVGTSCVSLDNEPYEVVESDEELETPALPPPAPDRGAPTSDALTFESVEPDDCSHLRESSCAEGEASLVVMGPQASLRASIPVIPNTSGTFL